MFYNKLFSYFPIIINFYNALKLVILQNLIEPILFYDNEIVDVNLWVYEKLVVDYLKIVF